MLDNPYSQCMYHARISAMQKTLRSVRAPWSVLAVVIVVILLLLFILHGVRLAHTIGGGGCSKPRSESCFSQEQT